MECSKLVGCTILLLVLIATGLHPTRGALCGEGKGTWPELVGVPGCKAAAIIERENKHVYAIVLPMNGPPAAGLVHHCNRVRVRIDHTGAVAIAPTIG